MVLIWQIEHCLTCFLDNNTSHASEDEHFITSATQVVAQTGSLGGVKTEFSSRKNSLDFNQFNMDDLICQLARIMSSSSKDSSSNAHGQKWWQRWTWIAATDARSYCPRDAEKLVGYLYMF
jgi:hypothetical protein